MTYSISLKNTIDIRNSSNYDAFVLNCNDDNRKISDLGMQHFYQTSSTEYNTTIFLDKNRLKKIHETRDKKNFTAVSFQPIDSNEEHVLISCNLVTTPPDHLDKKLFEASNVSQSYETADKIILSVYVANTNSNQIQASLDKLGWTLKKSVESSLSKNVTLVFEHTNSKNKLPINTNDPHSIAVTYRQSKSTQLPTMDGVVNDKGHDSRARGAGSYLLEDIETTRDTSNDSLDGVVEDKQQKPSSKRKWLVLAAVIVLLALAAVLFKDKLFPSNE